MSVIHNHWYVTQSNSLAFVESCYRQSETDSVLYKGWIISGIGQTKCVWDSNGVPFGSDNGDRLMDMVDNIELYLLWHYHILAHNFKERGENLNKQIAEMDKRINEAAFKGNIYDRLAVLEAACEINYSKPEFKTRKTKSWIPFHKILYPGK